MSGLVDTVHVFELACSQLQEGNEVTQASALLYSFRNSDSAATLMLCKHILTSSTHPTAPFHAASLLVFIVLREWSQKTSVFPGLRDEMLHLALTSSSTCCRKQLFRVVAIVAKREISVSSESIAHTLTQQCSEILLSTPLLAFDFIGALLSEFQSRRSSAIGLSMDFHLKVQECFERLVLPHLFRCLVQFLAQSRVVTAVLLALSCLAEVLSWEFTTPGLTYPAEEADDNNTPLTFAPPLSWEPSLLDPLLWEILRGMGLLVRPHASLCAVLLQLASIQGPLFEEKDTRLSKQTAFVRGLWYSLQPHVENLVTSQLLTAESAEHYLNISRVIHAMAVNFKAQAMLTLTDFIQNLFLWGRKLLQGYVVNESMQQAFDCITIVFSTLCEGVISSPSLVHFRSGLSQACSVLFEECVEVQLRTETDIGELGERLEDLAKLSSLDPIAALRCLTNCVGAMQPDRKASVIVMLFTFVLTNPAPGLPCKLQAPDLSPKKRAAIPPSILELKQPEIVAHSCLAMFQFMRRFFQSLRPESEMCLGPVLRFLARWTAGFLFRESFPRINSVELLEFLLVAVRTSVVHLCAKLTMRKSRRDVQSSEEEDEVGEVCDVLDALIQIPEACSRLRTSPLWTALATSLLEAVCFQETSLERVGRAIGMVQTASLEGNVNPALAELLRVVTQQFELVGAHPRFCEQRVRLLGITAGLAQCSSPVAYSLLFPSFLAPILQSQLHLYFNANGLDSDGNKNNGGGRSSDGVTDVVTVKLFRLFQHIGGSQLPHMDVEVTKRFVQTVMKLVRGYSQCVPGASLQQRAKEVETLLQVIVTVVCKDFADEYFSHHKLTPPPDVWAFVDEAGLSLLESLQPVLTDSLLQFSGVSTVYFLILETCVLCSPDRFARMQAQSRQILYAATQFGLSHQQPEVVYSALATIKFVARFYLKEHGFGWECEEGLLACYHALLHLMFFGCISSGSLAGLSQALLPLLLLNSNVFKAYMAARVLGGPSQTEMEKMATHLLDVTQAVAAHKGSRYGDFGDFRRRFLQSLHDLLGFIRPLLLAR